MKRPTNVWRRLAPLALAVLTSGAARAGEPNLLTNPNFDTDVVGWLPEPAHPEITIDHTTAHADGTHPAGSAQVTNTLASEAWVYQCVTVQAGATYRASGAAYMASGQTSILGSTLRILWYSDVCNGMSTGSRRRRS
jgi:hypothetical protein